MQVPPIVSSRVGAACSAASALLLFVLVAMTVGFGVSQQSFEVFAPPDAYAAALVEGAGALRFILLVDDVFVAAYMSATVLFVAWIAERRPSSLLRIVLGFGVVAGLLDLIENHHILAMIRAAETGFVPSPGEIEIQMVASSLKWVLGHIAFAMIGLNLRGKSPLVRGFRFALVAIQLPMGVLPFTLVSPGLLAVVGWARYGNLLVGFALLAYLMGRTRGGDAVGSSEPA